MNDLVPFQLVGENLVIEAQPIAQSLAFVYRGALLEPSADFRQNNPTIDAERALQEGITAPTCVPVIVRLLTETAEYESFYASVFYRATRARMEMRHTPAPKLLQAYGRNRTVLATAEELVLGTPLSALLDALRTRNEQMPQAFALAIGFGLLALWNTAAPRNVRISFTLQEVLIDPKGTVRAIPTYQEEESRQVVGAALFSLSTLISMTSPEEVIGRNPDGRSAMFYLGLLLYELLTLQYPFGNTNERLFETLTKLATQDAPPLRDFRPDIHPVVSQFVHRCLAREPNDRLSDWNELRAAYTGALALFPTVTPNALVAYATALVPSHPRATPPRVLLSGDWRALPGLRLPRFELPEQAERYPAPSTSAVAVTLDASARYAPKDGRPMYSITTELAIDARPVTRAEMERFYLATRTPIPEVLGAIEPLNADSPCVHVTVEQAQAYAAWAGKRIPTEQEWQQALDTLGAQKLGIGSVWEWTATPHERGGNVVRGGRWRDQLTLPAAPNNRSFVLEEAPDVGFRCVMKLS